MKKKLLWGILLCTAVSYGQTIDFLDSVFKSWLLATSTDTWRALDADGLNLAVDANSDGEIDETEALAVYELRFSYSGSADGQITSVAGVEHFTNLRVLELGSHNLSELNITALTHLQRLNMRLNPITMDNLHIDGLAELENINIDATPLVNFTPTGLASLKTLSIRGSQLNSLDLSGFPNLQYLQCSRNQITSLDASVTPLLISLTCDNNQITSLNLEGLQLTNLNCSDNPLQNLDVSELQTLISLDCQNIGINNIDLTNLTELVQLDVSRNPITTLDVSMLPSLQEINCNNTLLTELDLSTIDNPDLWVRASNNPLLVSINVHNGVVIEYPYESWIENNPNLEFICVDEGEQAGFLEFFENNDMVPPYMSSECNYEPGQAYNLISGKLTYDIDLNGCEAEDFVLSNIPVVISDGVTETTKFTNNLGEYQAYKGPGTYTITPTMENAAFTATPLYETAVFTAFDGTEQVYDFCITNSEMVTDAYISFYPLGNANPGFQNGYKLILKNKGNQWLNGTVTFTYDESVLDFVSANPVAGTTAPGTVTWDYTNLHPYETRYYVVYTNLNAPTDTPAVNIGDILNLTAQVTPTDNDIDLENNIFELEQEVTGSFDPNNIICLEGEVEEVENIGEYLHYLINFENTGTGAATFVVLTQEIDEEMFDLATFEILDNSHNMNASRTGNMVEYRFDDINLEPEAQGSVLFRIKTRTNLVEGDQVMNYANIVFDYNYAILTNEAITLFETIVMGTDDLAEPSTVSVYPNPVKDIINVNSDNTIISMELYDVNGRLLQTIMTNDTNANLDISSKAAGLYLLKVITDKGSLVQRIIKE